MKKYFLHFTFLFCYSLQSQTPWDLEQCIDYAKKHSISLRQTSINNEVIKNNSDQSKASLLPSINAGANHQYNFGQTIDRYTNKFANQRVLSQNFYIGSSVVLWSGMSQYNNVKANEYSYLSGVERLKQQENDLSLAVANAYIGVIFSEEVLKISRNQYQITKEQLERTQKLVTAGALAKSTEYDILSQLANEEVNVTSAENNVDLTLLNLKQLMNFDSVTNFALARPEISVQENLLIDNNTSNIYETALKNQPSIMSGEYNIMSSEMYMKASRGRYSPTLTFNANVGTGTSGLAQHQVGTENQLNELYSKILGSPYYVEVPIFQKSSFGYQFKNNVNKSLGFSLTVPIFNGMQNKTNVANAKLNSMGAKYTLDLAKQTLYKNIAQAKANAKAALNKYKATVSSVKAATESFFYAQQKMNAGTISAFEFNSNKSRVFAAESNMLQAKYDYIFKLKVIDYYLGKPLSL